MRLQGNGTIQQLERDKPRNKCRRWRIYQTADGKRHTKVVHGTVTDARAALLDLREYLSGKVSASESFANYANIWLSQRKSCGDYSPNTINTDSSLVHMLIDMLGDVALTDIDASMVRSAFADRRGLSGATMQKRFAALSSIMRQAEDDGLISSNPCAKVKPPKIDTMERHALTSAEFDELLAKLDAMQLDGRVIAVYLMLYQGLRSGECLALMWNDVEDGVTTVKEKAGQPSG